MREEGRKRTLAQASLETAISTKHGEMGKQEARGLMVAEALQREKGREKREGEKESVENIN